MNTDDFWGDKVEYIEKLAEEIADLKGVLQDISQQVRRIERRVDLILPEGRKKSDKASAGGGVRSAKVATISETEARQTIEKLKGRLYEDKPIEAELRNLTVKHGLTPIARELGLTNTALPPKTELVRTIITQLRMSVMLTENIRKASSVAEKSTKYGEKRNVNY